LECFHTLSSNLQGLSNLLGLLAVRLNELKTALIYNNKNKTYFKNNNNNNNNAILYTDGQMATQGGFQKGTVKI